MSPLSCHRKKLGGALGGLTSGFEAAQGAMGAFGVDAAQVEQALLKVQSAMAIQQGFQGIRESIPSFKALGTSATEAFGKMTTAGKAFAVTGIGLLLTGVGLLIANFDKLQSMFSKTSEKQKVLNSTLDAYRSGAASAKAETDKVALAFDQARKGTIKKEEALKIYNDTLGDTFGKSKNVNDAETEFIKKKDAYIQAAALRAQAQAVMQLASEEYAKSLTSQLEDQRDWAEQSVSAVNSALAGILDYSTAGLTNVGKTWDKEEQKIYQDAQKRAKKASEDRQKILQDAYKDLTTQANKIDKEYNLKSEEANAIAEEQSQKELERQQKLKEAREKAAEARTQALDEIKQAEKEYQDSLLTDKDLEIKNATEKYDALLAKARKYNQDTTQLENAKKNELNNINVKYAQEAQAIEEERIAKEQWDNQLIGAGHEM